MRDNRYYYGTGPDGNRRGIRKDPAYRAEMARRDVLRLRAMIAEIDHTIMALERSIEAELELAALMTGATLPIQRRHGPWKPAWKISG